MEFEIYTMRRKNMKQRKTRYLLLIFCLIMLTACNGKTTKKQVNSNRKLSQILDVKKMQIKSDDGYGSLRIINPVVENKSYVFYIENGKKIIKVNKQSKEKSVIVTFKRVNKGGLSLEGNYLYYIYNQEIYKSNFKGKYTKILSKENLKKCGVNAEVVSVKMYHNKLYIIMEDYTNLYVVQYNEEKYKVLIKGYMRQICFGGECLYYIDKGGAGIYEINLNTQKQQRIRGIKWYEDYEMDNHPIYMEITVYNGKLYYTKWETKDDIGRQVMYEYEKNEKDKKIFEFQGGANAIADSTKVIVDEVMYDSEHEGMQEFDLKDNKSYIIKKPTYKTGGINFLIDDVILYEDDKSSNNVYIMERIK